MFGAKIVYIANDDTYIGYCLMYVWRMLCIAKMWANSKDKNLSPLLPTMAHVCISLFSISSRNEHNNDTQRDTFRVHLMKCHCKSISQRNKKENSLSSELSGVLDVLCLWFYKLKIKSCDKRRTKMRFVSLHVRILWCQSFVKIDLKSFSLICAIPPKEWCDFWAWL